MLIKYRSIDGSPETATTMYIHVDGVEINQSIQTCVIHMPSGFSAFVYGDDINRVVGALECNMHIFDFNSLSDSAEFFNKYGDRLIRYEGEIK